MTDISKTNVLTTEKVQEIMEKEKFALKLKRTELLWQSNNHGVRKPGISFAMTKDERKEYTKCKLSVFYFAEKFCKIKREDGSIGEIELRDYQNNIVKLFNDNRYSILMASRQTGKCVDFNTIVRVRNNNGINDTTIGSLYYNYLDRNLTVMEKIKIFLYKIILKLND